MVRQRRREDAADTGSGTNSRRKTLRRPSNPAESCLVLGQPLPQQGGCSHATKVSVCHRSADQSASLFLLTLIDCLLTNALYPGVGYDRRASIGECSPCAGSDFPAVGLHTLAMTATLLHKKRTPLA